ncbi:hypothetical protein [Sphingobacterium hotanense]|uniref:hypothetical protein n=1 Tax=Sphingobacterium hotanense TaxID=649196 RepID=UPI0021A274B4|nr:hypothetical protein [Sphingobacterium hotanense]MCT1525508.1 hypothetical protein [Sphingobacterium hotanense]
MFEFDIFREEVLTDYTKKRNEGTLPTSLENPSPANLRNYASNKYRQGLSKEDRTVFEEYFNSNAKVDDLEKAIRTTDLGRLKSVQNFLNGTTKIPDEIIVKLVAVLIDFSPRPFVEWRNSFQHLQHGESKASNDSENSQMHNNVARSQPVQDTLVTKPTKKNHLNKILAISAASLSFAAVGYMTSSQLKSDGCMYWDGAQYVKIDCKEEIKHAEKLILDPIDLIHFKKITQTDTLQEEHVNKVWYSKINNEVEFFTSAGRHPLHKERTLKPATWYMIKKYKGSNPTK